MQYQRANYRPVLIIAPKILAGAEKVVIYGSEALINMKIDPLIIVIKEKRAPQYAREFVRAFPRTVDVREIEANGLFHFSLSYKIKNILKKEKLPLVIHTHGLKALIAVYLMRMQIPHIHTHHGTKSHSFKVRIYEKLAMKIMKKCNHLIAVSNRMKDELQMHLAPFDKISVINNLLPLKNTETIRIKKNIIKNALPNVVKLIFIGKLNPEKGLINFLHFLLRSPLKDNFKLTILGDGIEKKIVEAFIKNHHNNLKIDLIGFVVDPTPFLAEADLLVIPSLKEGLPLTIIEALASGVPILANDVGAIASLVHHGHNGFLTTGFEYDDWNHALGKTLEEIEKWKKNAQEEGVAIEEKFSPIKWAEKTNSIYQSLL